MEEVILQEVSTVGQPVIILTLADVIIALENERLSQYATANWVSYRHAQIPAIRNILPLEPTPDYLESETYRLGM